MRKGDLSLRISYLQTFTVKPEDRESVLFSSRSFPKLKRRVYSILSEIAKHLFRCLYTFTQRHEWLKKQH